MKKINWGKYVKFSNMVIAFLVVINILPVLAPILQSMGATFPARVIYFIYSFMCHQIHWRSLHVADHQCAWCTRDMAIWGAVLVSVVLIKIFKIKGLKWYHVLPLTMPIALDGGIQTIASMLSIGGNTPIYVSTNLMRMVTGGLFGLGIGGFIGSMVMETEGVSVKDRIILFSRNIPARLFLIVATLSAVFFGYVAYVQVWNFTSSRYKPSDILDSQVKLPSVDEEFVIKRRENAVCPAEISSGKPSSDPIRLDCFLGRE